MATAPSWHRSTQAPVFAVAVFVAAGIFGGGTHATTAITCPPAAIGPMAAVSWPVSTGLLVSEVVTGGGSASDEFVEIYNASSETLDLTGLELVYATSTGSTVTRKQAWTALPLAAHSHLLLANAAGVFGAGADGLYSGGFSATGGSLVLRVVGGSVIDSLSWGDASSGFVEGTPGIAPAAQFSLERLPGGDQGNATDSNDNVADTWINPSPVPHSTASAPVPRSSDAPSVAPTFTLEPSAEPSPSGTATPEPSGEPAPTSHPAPTAAPTPQPTVLCTPQPSTPVSPTNRPTATPIASATAGPTPAPTAAAIPIAAARTQSIGARVVVRGVVTVAPGWILGDLALAILDDTAGIYVRLPQMSTDGIVPGRTLQVDGLLAAPFGNLEIRPSIDGVQLLETASPPAPIELTLDQLGESAEGLLAHVEGTISRIEGSGVSSLTVIIEDATGEGRVFAHSTLGVTRDDFSVGERVRVTGLVGDRLGLYRIWPRNRFDIVVVEPAPTATPRPNPTRTPSPRPTPRPTPTRTPTPTRPSSPTPPRPNEPEVSISEALRRPGAAVTISGVATTRSGLLDADGQRVAVQDSSGAILVRLPEGFTAQPGQRLRVTGEVGTYYNAPQLTATAATRFADTSVQPLMVRAAPVAAALEWRLVVVSGKVESVNRDGESWRAEISISGGGVPVVGLARSGIPSTALIEGRDATITGIAKRAYPTASDQRYAVVPRSAADIKLGQGSGAPGDASPYPGNTADTAGAPWFASPWPSAGFGNESNAPRSSGPETARAVALADLGAYVGTRVTVGGEVVGVQAGRVSIDDGTAVATVVLHGPAASAASAASIGDLLNAIGIAALGADGGFEIIVEDANAISWLDLQASRAPAPLGATATTSSAATGASEPTPNAGSTDGTRMVAIALFAVALAALGVTLLASPATRQRLRAWLVSASAALKQRLAALRSS